MPHNNKKQVVLQTRKRIMPQMRNIVEAQIRKRVMPLNREKGSASNEDENN